MVFTYNSTRYKKWREKVFQRDHFTCQLCNSRGDLNAHHIKKKSLFPKLAHILKNGITLCVKCHKVVTGSEEVFEPLFIKIINKNLNLEFIYRFFNTLTGEYKTIVQKFKTHNKWLRIPHTILRHVPEYSDNTSNKQQEKPPAKRKRRRKRVVKR